MTEVSDRVIGRIRKMLTLANDAGASQGERDNALRMAHATLAKYNLDIAAINAGADPSRRGPVDPRIEHRATFYGRPWARLIAQAIGELMFCKYLFIRRHLAKDTVHLFVGSHANSVSAAILSQFVVESIIREGKRNQRANGAGNAWFRSFAIGAGLAIAERCTRLRSDATGPVTTAGGAPGRPNATDPAYPEPPGSAIVLRSVYDREAEANESYVKTIAVSDRPPRSHDLMARTSMDPMSEGVAYGRKIPLHKQVK